MHFLEYLLALPLICLGSIIKLRTLPMNTFKKVIYGLGLIPFTLFALFMAVIRFPQYANERAHILNNSPHGRFWLLKQLWNRPVPPPTPLATGGLAN